MKMKREDDPKGKTVVKREAEIDIDDEEIADLVALVVQSDMVCNIFGSNNTPITCLLQIPPEQEDYVQSQDVLSDWESDDVLCGQEMDSEVHLHTVKQHTFPFLYSMTISLWRKLPRQLP